MAFAHAPTITLVADNLVRLWLSDISENFFGLAEGDSGTISLFEGAGEVVLPAAFKPRVYHSENATDVTLQDSIQVEITNEAGGVILSSPIRVVKTGTTPANFLITLTNDAVAEVGSAVFELYVRFH